MQTTHQENTESKQSVLFGNLATQNVQRKVGFNWAEIYTGVYLL